MSSNQEPLRKYELEYKTKITEETKLKVGDIVQMGTEYLFKLTSVSKCFVTIENIHDRYTAPIFECDGEIVGVYWKVYKTDANAFEFGLTRRKSRKYLIENGFCLRTDLDNIYSVYKCDYLC
jgi:hypothetical protein